MLHKADASRNDRLTHQELHNGLDNSIYVDFIRWFLSENGGKPSRFKAYDHATGRDKGSIHHNDFQEAVADWVQGLNESQLSAIGFPAERRVEPRARVTPPARPSTAPVGNGWDSHGDLLGAVDQAVAELEVLISLDY